MAMKFNFGKIKDIGKEVGKSALGDVGNVSLIAAGTIASKKFIDLKNIFKNLPADHWAIKWQGAIKVGAGLMALMMFYKKIPPFARMMIYGMMLEGGLTTARKLTTQTDGKSFFEPIGNGSIEQLPPISEQYKMTVAGRNELQDEFNQNSYSGVAGVSGSGYNDDRY